MISWINLHFEIMYSCVFCGESNGHPMQCKDKDSWTRLYCAVAIRKHGQILDLSTAEHNFPPPVKYHVSCRKEFVNQKSLQIITRKTRENTEAVQDHPQLRRSTCDLEGLSDNSAVLCQDICYFVRKENTNREQEHGKTA